MKSLKKLIINETVAVDVNDAIDLAVDLASELDDLSLLAGDDILASELKSLSRMVEKITARLNHAFVRVNK